MLKRLAIWITLLALVGFTVPASAQVRLEPGAIMAPAEAHAKAISGDVVLVDIRTPEEWRQTGIPASAEAITMHQDAPKFLAALDKATGGDKTKPVALICRTGSRSAFLQAELKKAGYSRVINVAEGVVGGPAGQGWAKSGLPLKKP
jgi:rhodanese-related sulfurtransferase